jgi:hypothetical protein
VILVSYLMLSTWPSLAKLLPCSVKCYVYIKGLGVVSDFRGGFSSPSSYSTKASPYLAGE